MKHTITKPKSLLRKAQDLCRLIKKNHGLKESDSLERLNEFYEHRYNHF